MRGYITGSAWQEYAEKGTVHGMKLVGPKGRKLIESERLEKPLYTPCKCIWTVIEENQQEQGLTYDG